MMPCVRSSAHAELKQDLQGKHEYEAYLKTTLAKKADLEKRVEANKHWIVSLKTADIAR